MVTQDAAVVPKVNKVKMKKMKKKKSKKKKIKGTENLDSESEVDKLDLDQRAYPLSHYISDQEELVNQMFMTIRGSKLEAMLPPVLKSIPLKDLKRLCLHELRGMSKKRILCCINGQVMEGSSGSEDEEEEKEEVNEDPKHNEANTKGEKRKPGDEQPPDSYLQKKIKVEPGLDSTGSGEGKSVLELLELEMRARIIKTMLEKGDEGKKITEDAIAAVMQSAKQITKEGVDATGGNKEIAGAVANSKNDSLEKESDREAEDEDEAVEERSRGRRRGQGKGTDRRGRHNPARDSKKASSTRSQKRRDGSYSDGNHGRSSKKQKEFNIPEKHVMKKKKITRKEFEERMKRAKKNRTYRQRKSSEDEEKTKQNENQTESTKEDKDENTEDKIDKKQDTPPGGNNIQDKTEGEASEKEEGEIDSNEEEEGACSPSDISSASRYSSSGSSSRSRSRSYSRSLSRSPYRSRQRSRRRSRSRRRRRKSYSRSYSRSRTPDRRRSRGDYQQRSFERKRSRESPKGNSKMEIKKTSPEDISPSREEDWGHKCDIEFVDSEEDFDDNPEATKKDSGAQKTLPVNRTERASISFSLQKKPVGIAQNVDLDDLPLKKKQMSSMTDDVETLGALEPTTGNEEIVISSDSEVELQASTQKSLTEAKSDGKKQSEQQLLVTNTNNYKLGGTKNTDQPFNKENISLQSDQEKKPVKKVGDSETDNEETTKGIMEESTEVSLKLTSGLNLETCTEQKSTDGAKIIQDVNSKNTEVEREKQAVKNIDEADSVVSINKGESLTKDSKDDSDNMDSSESTKLDCDDTPEKLNRDKEEHVIPHENKQVEKDKEMLSIDSAESVNAESATNWKEKGSECLSKEKIDVDTAEAHTSRVVDVGRVDDDGSSTKERKMTKSEFHMDIEQTSDKESKKITEKGVNVKDKCSIQSLEEEDQRNSEVSISSQTTESKLCKEKGGKKKVGDASVCLETEEKNENLTANKQKDAELDRKEAGSIFEDESEEEFYRGAEQLKFSEDEKDNEDINMKEFLKDKTPVEPIRIETGLARRHMKPSQKIEMIMPERSWMKRDRKKKVKDVLGIERVGLLKSAQSEGVHSSSQESELETETSQGIQTVETVENEEMTIHSPALISDTENSQPAEEPGGQKQACPSPKQDSLPEVSHAEDKTLRKIDHDTEIIGVIETSKDTSDNFDDMELGGSSWSMRWLQSEKVQKVVTSSKMLSRVRKKIQRKEKATKVVMAEKVEETQKPSESAIPVIGSIEEYERLIGTKVKKDEAPSAAGGSGSQDNVGEVQVSCSSSQIQDDIPESKNKGNPVFGSDDDGEDSEEEALWSKIIKK